MGSYYLGRLIGNYNIESIEYYTTGIYAIVELCECKPAISARAVRFRHALI
jgi:hypothetical protein